MTDYLFFVKEDNGSISVEYAFSMAIAAIIMKMAYDIVQVFAVWLLADFILIVQNF